MLANLLSNGNFEAATVSPWTITNASLVTTECITGTKSMLIQPNGRIRQQVTAAAGTYNISFRLRAHDGVPNYSVQLVNVLTNAGAAFTMDLKNLDAYHDHGINAENTVRRVHGQIKVTLGYAPFMEIKNLSSSADLMVDDICMWKTFEQFPANGQVRSANGWFFSDEDYIANAYDGVWLNPGGNVNMVSPRFVTKTGVYYKVVVEFATEATVSASITVKFNNQTGGQNWRTAEGDLPANSIERRELTFKAMSDNSLAVVILTCTASVWSDRINIRKCRVYEIDAMASPFTGQPDYTLFELWKNISRPNAVTYVDTYMHPVARAHNPDFAGDCTGNSIVGDVFENTTLNAPNDGSWYALTMAMGDFTVLIDNEKRADFYGFSTDHTFYINGGQNIRCVSLNTNAIMNHLDVRKVSRPTIAGQLLKNPDFLEGYANWIVSGSAITKRASRSINLELSSGTTLQQTVTLSIGNYRVVSRTVDGSASKTHGMNVKRGTTALANRAAMPSADGHTSFKNTVAGSVTFTFTANANMTCTGIYLFSAPDFTDRPKNNDFTNGQSFWMPFSSYEIITPDDFDCYCKLLAGQYIDSYSSGCTLVAGKNYTISIRNRSSAAVQLSVTVGSTVLSNQSLASTSGNWQTRTITFSSGSSAGNAVIRITAASGSPTDIKYISVSS